MSRSIPCLVFFALAPLVGGGTGNASAQVAEVIDSAGVSLVLNHLPDGPMGTGGLSLDAEPMLEIHTFEGDTPYQLFRVAGARRLADGRVVVANAGSFEVRVYTADGRYQRAWGQEGSGPGEFLDMRLVGAMSSDTVVVLDNRNRRFSFMHPDEGFLGSVPIDEEVRGSPLAQGVFEDGTVVTGGGAPPSSARVRCGTGPGGHRPTSVHGRAMARWRRISVSSRATRYSCGSLRAT